jgi:hypothetical protein
VLSLPFSGVFGWKGILKFSRAQFVISWKIWDRVTFLACLWNSAHGMFRSVYLLDMRGDWNALLVVTWLHVLISKILINIISTFIKVPTTYFYIFLTSYNLWYFPMCCCFARANIYRNWANQVQGQRYPK